jgi:hypothetical protein
MNLLSLMRKGKLRKGDEITAAGFNPEHKDMGNKSWYADKIEILLLKGKPRKVLLYLSSSPSEEANRQFVHYDWENKEPGVWDSGIILTDEKSKHYSDREFYMGYFKKV